MDSDDYPWVRSIIHGVERRVRPRLWEARRRAHEYVFIGRKGFWVGGGIWTADSSPPPFDIDHAIALTASREVVDFGSGVVHAL